MMDLHGVVKGIISAVNPLQQLTLRVSIGWQTDSAGKRTPTYAPDVIVEGEVQPLQYRDLVQIDGLNLNGTRRKIYFEGEVDALVRVSKKGGDLIVDAAGNVWLTAVVVEQWPDWCAVIVTLQNGS